MRAIEILCVFAQALVRLQQESLLRLLLAAGGLKGRRIDNGILGLLLSKSSASLARCLKPGGRFLTVNSSPLNDFISTRSYGKYGFDAQATVPLRAGAPITWTFFLEDGETFAIENYFLDQPTHEAAFRAAGFSEIDWPAPR